MKLVKDINQIKTKNTEISDEKAEEAVKILIQWLGEDPNREGLLSTPKRVVKAFKEYFNGYKFNLGADARHHISDKFSVLLDGDAVVIPTEDIFWESKLLGEYQLNDKWGILLGTKLTYGNYPFGTQTRLLPLIDITYRWTK